MNVGLLGYGNVAQGLVKLLDKSNTKGNGIVITKILRRRGKATSSLMTEDPQEILENDDIDVVVELLGGIHPAYEYIRAALNSGKHVVTANKALINTYGDELNALARKKKVGLLLSAACGGGIPIQPTILENKPLGIQAISGILNGTSNYILDEMETKGLPFATALKQAQKLGYAEADPSSDIDGMDTLYKIRLAIAVGLNTWVDIDSILLEGIRFIESEDIVEIKKLGYRVRLIAKGELKKKHLHMSVEPTLVTEDSAEARTQQNYNLCVLTPERGNLVFLSGQGAGGDPTATNVFRDLLYTRAGQKEMLPETITHKKAHNEELTSKYFIRLEEGLSLKDASWIDKKWSVEDYHYYLTKEISSFDVHQELHALREKGKVFFARVA